MKMEDLYNHMDEYTFWIKIWERILLASQGFAWIKCTLIEKEKK